MPLQSQPTDRRPSLRTPREPATPTVPPMDSHGSISQRSFKIKTHRMGGNSLSLNTSILYPQATALSRIPTFGHRQTLSSSFLQPPGVQGRLPHTQNPLPDEQVNLALQTVGNQRLGSKPHQNSRFELLTTTFSGRLGTLPDRPYLSPDDRRTSLANGRTTKRRHLSRRVVLGGALSERPN